LRYYDKIKGSEVFSKVKDKLKEGLDIGTNDKKEQGCSLLEANELKREIIPLFEGAKDDIESNSKETEKVISIFGEEIVITKRKIKVGELVIKKNRVTVNNRIEIDIKKEETTVNYPEPLRY
jgi:stress response protein YsnF